MSATCNWFRRGICQQFDEAVCSNRPNGISAKPARACPSCPGPRGLPAAAASAVTRPPSACLHSPWARLAGPAGVAAVDRQPSPATGGGRTVFAARTVSNFKINSHKIAGCCL